MSVERPRRLPLPWTIDENRSVSYIVRDANDFTVAHVYFEEEPGLRATVNLKSKDEARKIADGIAKLADQLLGAEQKPDSNPLVQRKP
jgi:hypothetical protein